MYIVLIDLDWGHKIETYFSDVPKLKNAVLSCVSKIKYPRIGVKSILKIKSNILINPYGFQDIVALKGICKVYNVSLCVNGINIDVNIVNVQHETNSLYTIFVYYKGGTYVNQHYNVNPLQALKHWARYMSYRFYSKEEKKAARKIVSEIKELNVVIEGFVWNLDCTLLGNSLKVYVVKS